MTEYPVMEDPFSPGLSAARRFVAMGGAEAIIPIGESMPSDPAGAVLLVEHAPCDELLAALAAALPRAAAVVLWAPGWDQAAAVAALRAHGFDYGSVDIFSVGQPGALAVLVGDAAAAERLISAAPERARPPFRPLAIMPAFNEADVVYHAIGALIAGGVDVYLIDHESTDGTADAAAPWLGRGLLGIERFPDDSGYAARNHGVMVWREILARVQELSGEIDAPWYLFVNADEFREAPWPGITLAEGLREADELGYSAVNFELLNFRPVDDGYVPGEDPRRHLRYYEAPARHDLLQVKAWKRQPAPVDLVHHGGHDVLFEGKRVYPVPFLLRHYPIRSSEHGARKVLAERLPRFAAEERADGWHVQYDHYVDATTYLHDPAQLHEWDPDRFRAQLLATSTRRLILATSLSNGDPSRGELDASRLAAWMTRRGAPISATEDLLAAKERLLAAVGGAPMAQRAPLDDAAAELGLAMESAARLRGDMVSASALGDGRERLRAGRAAARVAPATPAAPVVAQTDRPAAAVGAGTGSG
jgi:glycosyltransferase involved in cell wall biosynthesis